jgi:ligand-binding sensor domain-containing protein
MEDQKKKNDRLITAAIILVSVAGILYFGIRAISENPQKAQENPFEYNVDNFKKSDAGLHNYTEIRQIPVDVNKVKAITLDSENNLYAAGQDLIQALNSQGNEVNSFPVTGLVNCLAVDENSDLYLGFYDHIEVYDNKGTIKSRWESLGAKAIITSIALTQDSVLAADAGNTVVWRIDRTGKVIQKIGEKNEAKDIPGFMIPSPYFDLAIDPDGFLWVTNTGRHSLENYTSNGDFRSSWGEFSMKPEGFCGCCNPTHIAILEDGTFVTSEKGIPRVKVYNRIGELVSIVAGPDEFKEGTVGLDLAVDSDQRIYVLDPVQKAVRIFEKKK